MSLTTHDWEEVRVPLRLIRPLSELDLRPLSRTFCSTSFAIALLSVLMLGGILMRIRMLMDELCGQNSTWIIAIKRLMDTATL